MPEVVEVTLPVIPIVEVSTPEQPVVEFFAVQGAKGDPGDGADVVTIIAAENISGGSFVSFTAGGVVKADASNALPAHGFVKASVMSGQLATVYGGGLLNGLAGLTVGVTYYLSGTLPGQLTATAPSGAGKFAQRLGVATAVDSVLVELGQPIITV